MFQTHRQAVAVCAVVTAALGTMAPRARQLPAVVHCVCAPGHCLWTQWFPHWRKASDTRATSPAPNGWANPTYRGRRLAHRCAGHPAARTTNALKGEAGRPTGSRASGAAVLSAVAEGPLAQRCVPAAPPNAGPGRRPGTPSPATAQPQTAGHPQSHGSMPPAPAQIAAPPRTQHG